MMASIRFCHNKTTIILPISQATYQYARLQRDVFLASLETPSLGTEPAISELELLSRFIIHLSNINRSESREDLLTHVWQYVVVQLLSGRDIHEVMHELGTDVSTRRRVMRLYTEARLAVVGQEWQTKSALLEAQTEGRAQLYGIFGGQGNTKHYFDELRSTFESYGPLVRHFIHLHGRMLEDLALNAQASEQLQEGICVMKWLEHPECAPDIEYFLSAPVSFPLIGLLQLTQFKSISMSLGMTPGTFNQRFRALAGHSQGAVVAAAVSTARSWSEYDDATAKALTILFWIGVRSQQVFKQEPLSIEHAQLLQTEGHGTPSPMLSVSGILQEDLRGVLQAINGDLPAACHASISLVNTPSSFVVSGPERTLAGLVNALRATVRNAKQRSATFTHFLPITVPCHSPLLDAAVPLIDEDLHAIFIPAHTMGLPVFASATGLTEMARQENADIVPPLVRMITSQPVDWPSVNFEGATHVIDFGPGATGGVGRITSENTMGCGVRVLLAGKQQQSDDIEQLGSLPEVFQSKGQKLVFAPDWDKAYRARLLHTAQGPVIATKLSEILKLPPILVAGMTPTTTHPDFVAAIFKAGYHAEFATGGYHNADALRSALTQLQDMIPIGRTITANVIYASPKALSWQIPLLAQLRSEGMPITGLTVGGGVPSLDVATEYISTLGLEHISFKPSSAEAIRHVVDIARANPMFPIILQWTGGRGGGHHSSEDFHEPILETYDAIRRCDNLALVAGSGFGCAEDVLPYFTGTWSLRHGRTSVMPFDGILLGSRIMCCAEAHTSPGTKRAIAAARGVEDKEWRMTYKAPTGGVISVVSEMGEPIHVIATRGAQFWSELDKSIFSLDRKQRLAALEAKKGYIISRLNADSQRPWFGRKPNDTACDITDMTYVQILERLVELMYVDGWVDASYEKLVGDLIARIQARLSTHGQKSVCLEELRTKPHTVLEKLIHVMPEITNALCCPEDAHFLVQSCRKSGNKPVPFIPVLDDNFETWFKKDSLWQSENLDAVVEQDAGRTFILHGPVAARHTHTIDEPVAYVLDGICQDVLEHVTAQTRTDYGPCNMSEDFVGSSALANLWQHIVPATELDLLHTLQSRRFSWAIALLGTEFIIRSRERVANPWRVLLAEGTFTKVEVLGETILLHTSQIDASTVEISKDGKRIRVVVETNVTPSSTPVQFVFEFDYHPDTPYAPIWEVMSHRNLHLCDVYRSLWSCRASVPTNKPSLTNNMFVEEDFLVKEGHVQAFNRAIGYQSLHGRDAVTLDYAMVVSWSAMASLLLQQPRNILSLVHLSNSYEVHDHSRPLQIGDKLRIHARVEAMVVRDTGLQIDIACELRRTATDVATLSIRSCFLFRDASCDASDSFKHEVLGPYEVGISSPSDLAVLISEPWFRRTDDSKLHHPMSTNMTLQFQLQQHSDSRGARTWGSVYTKSDSRTPTVVGKVEHATKDIRVNSVLSYLLRRARKVPEGSPSMQAPSRAQDTATHTSQFRVPASNQAYSRASGDFNPIHTSLVLAYIAGLPGTITHGMYCSAIVRQVLERHLCGQHSERIRRYEVNFVGMVLPNATLEVNFRFAGMKAGHGEYDIEVRDNTRGERVLAGTATIAQPSTTIVFSGQGSQEQGMGMDLFASSTAARCVWDKADAYFRSYFGLSILEIVRNNPKEITVHFAGARGLQLRRNYQSMQYDMPSAIEGGLSEVRPMFPTIDDRSTSFTHTSPTGLLFTTQFAQPALAIMETAAFQDLQAASVIDPDFRFTGHSLGEYTALACSTGFLPLTRMIYFFFCRGMTMQSAVERDGRGRSIYSMVAVDPSRVAQSFDEILLRKLIARIQVRTGFFVELVNLNIRNKQYVCAGDLRALDLLQKVCDQLKLSSDRGGDVEQHIEQLPERGDGLKYVDVAAADVSLRRGLATTPLPGIDVPFHSAYLRPKMEAFRRVLLDSLDAERLTPEGLVGRYIPNVTGTPFRIDREYFNEVWEATRSEKLDVVLRDWHQWMGRVERERMMMATA